MQKRSLTIIVIALLCALVTAFALVGCGKVDFKLNFVVDGEVYDTISTNGKEAIKLPDNPKKDGYIFDGWYWDNEFWKKPFTANSLLDTPLSSDMSVYAKFEKEEAVKGTQAEFVGFEKTGENKYLKKVSNDTEIFSLGTSVKVNSKSSWQLSSDVYGNNVIASKTATLSAGDNYYYVNVIADDGTMQLYTLNIRRRKIYTVEFDTFGGTDIEKQYIEEDSCATAPATANRTGYTFKSWAFDFSTPIVENTVISAKWNVITYNIEYVLNGGENNSLNPTIYTIESEDIVLQIPSKTGYDFIGWYTDKALTEKVEDVATGSYGAKKFYAKWTPTVYAIEYELNGGENNSANLTSYTIESEDVVLQSPSKTNYDFVGWYADETLTEKVEKISVGSYGNRKFYAKWTPIVYTIEYELNGGKNNSLNPNTYTIESKDIILQTPGKEGYDFVGWYQTADFSDKKITKIPLGSTGNKKFYAKWESNKYFLFRYGTITGLTDYGKTCSKIVIPEKLYNITVTLIGAEAFKDCTELTSVVIPDSVTSIGEYAFYGCKKLTSVTIPNSVTSIGSYTFFDCTGLTSVNIPDSVANIGSYTFFNCTGLTSVNIPDSVTSIGWNVFSYCEKLTSVTIPNSVTSIGNWAFYGCKKLTSVNIPNSVTSIGDWAFYGCTGLTSVTIPDSVTSIRELAFGNCSGLTNVTIPDSVTSIGDSAFSYCKRLTSVTIPDSVTSIGNGAFSDCMGLTSVTIPDSVTSIGGYAFSGCIGLTIVTIGNSVASIGEGAFSGCTGLTSVAITNSVTSIGDSAFSYCNRLTSVTIPDSVGSIGSWAFYECKGLKTIYYKGTEEEWKVILKRSNWDDSAGNYTIVYNA